MRIRRSWFPAWAILLFASVARGEPLLAEPWARYGHGKTPDDEAALRWMHCGRDDPQASRDEIGRDGFRCRSLAGALGNVWFWPRCGRSHSLLGTQMGHDLSIY